MQDKIEALEQRVLALENAIKESMESQKAIVKNLGLFIDKSADNFGHLEKVLSELIKKLN